MSTLKEIENAVTKLSQKDFRKFRSWFDELEAKSWDEQLEKNIREGKLENFAQCAIKDFESKNR